MTARLQSSGRSGFTLIELVISTALMAMILGGAYLCLRAGLASQELVESRDEVFQSARVALALLSADLRCACPLSKKSEFVGMHRMLGDVRADNLDFATHNYIPRHAREADWCEVSYFLDKDRGSQKFSLWRRRDPTPDEDPFSGGKREEIAAGLLGLKFEYYDGIEWYDEWGDAEGNGKAQTSLKERYNLSGLPDAVRVTLLFDSSLRKARENKPATSKSAEPPLVFQTVARLNLAAAAFQSSEGGSSTNSTSAIPDQAAPPSGPGGPP